ncbi:acetyl/propionyl/methylcrotonyl-CoA carboxylase subunit alpha [Arthrobacter sp. 2MCAF15]|uniref:acetyl-CoA carboxylase biotin carboxylase subunit n=1 Tax=Arthrobacter sp. 2MCAF15 TaxID=3232984 RepID=UPI003F8E36C6
MTTQYFQRVLVANRGEIAVRIIRTLRRLGIESVAVYSEPEAGALHVKLADHAVCIGSGPVSESYLLGARIIAAAAETNAEAIHPGYGLLSENAGFARACKSAGLVFIGPAPEAMEAMGAKIASRQLMERAGVPVVPGGLEAVTEFDSASKLAVEIGYPVAVKASGAGGGKGFRVATAESELAAALEGARGEGERFFGDGTVYLERYLEDPRHIEIQILADGHGNVVHLFERDCSIQRRHQKLIEEAPAPHVSSKMRQEIGQIAIAAARAVGYTSAGTVEGLLADGTFYFLEMNTRIQVEHGVTEMVTGIDIVEEQIRVAAGLKLSINQDDLTLTGHAIECRLNAEDPGKNFRPSPGLITRYVEPKGNHIRVDSGVDEGSQILPFYDPLFAKLIVWGEDRAEATERMLQALDSFEVEGVKTLLPFHRAIMTSEEWGDAHTCRDLVSNASWLKGLVDRA